jgi:hypothetical protein
MVRVSISEPDAFARYPFPEEFRLGTIVQHKNGDRGKIIDAVYEGASSKLGGSYTIIYTVEQENRVYYYANEFELRKISHTENV